MAQLSSKRSSVVSYKRRRAVRRRTKHLWKPVNEYRPDGRTA